MPTAGCWLSVVWAACRESQGNELAGVCILSEMTSSCGRPRTWPTFRPLCRRGRQSDTRGRAGATISRLPGSGLPCIPPASLLLRSWLKPSHRKFRFVFDSENRAKPAVSHWLSHVLCNSTRYKLVHAKSP